MLRSMHLTGKYRSRPVEDLSLLIKFCFNKYKSQRQLYECLRHLGTHEPSLRAGCLICWGKTPWLQEGPDESIVSCRHVLCRHRQEGPNQYNRNCREVSRSFQAPAATNNQPISKGCMHRHDVVTTAHSSMQQISSSVCRPNRLWGGWVESFLSCAQ